MLVLLLWKIFINTFKSVCDLIVVLQNLSVCDVLFWCVSVWDAVVCDVCQLATFEQNCLSFVGVSFMGENGLQLMQKSYAKWKLVSKQLG